MGDILFYLFMLLMLIAAVGAGVFVLRGYLSGGTSPATKLFKPRAERRLAVVDQANVDGRRRLLLIRRDNVEHLIMTGGPVDVVIETNIAPAPVAADASVGPALVNRAERVLKPARNETEQAAE